MPNPTKRHSRGRRDRRRAHDALPLQSLSRCPQCQEMKRPHHVCPHCGTYRGRSVIEIKEA